jgi:uncharacterized protein
MDDDFLEYAEPARVLSPCVDICVLDPDTGWCIGCGRTGDEIGDWPDASDARRQAILDALPPRML